MLAPCKDCPDRHNLCWSGCDKYKAFRAKREMISNGLKRESDMYYGPRESKVRRPTK